MTIRQAILKFRKDTQQVNADSTFTNRYLYESLNTQAKWLIKREVSAGRIYKNNSLFQTLRAFPVIEVDVIPSCLNINTGCKIYRTKYPLPEMWVDNNGPIIRYVSSLDNSTRFTVTTVTAWDNKKEDPYQKISREKYCFIIDGYLYLPEHNPHFLNINGFFVNDIALAKKDPCTDCDNDDEDNCVRFLDTTFNVPEWLYGELFAKALQYVSGGTLRVPEDQQIDKNSNRKN